MMMMSLLLSSLLALSHASYLSGSWSMLVSERPSTPRCVPIPENLTICHGIQYTEMRLPNVLEHESVEEVVHQGKDWESLLRLNCHPDTQLFLCSLFAPVCVASMDRYIPPCNSLCEAVKTGCEGRMLRYGFPWPSMLNCSRFPDDHDMCIRPVAPAAGGSRVAPVSGPPTGPHSTPATPPQVSTSCSACSQVDTYENLIDNFCRAQMVIKGRVIEAGPNKVRVRGGRSLRKGDRRRSVGETTLLLAEHNCSCTLPSSPDSRYVVMASKNANGELVASLILPWKKDGPFKRAVHQFSRLNCHSLGREIRESASRRPHSWHMRRHNTHSKTRV